MGESIISSRKITIAGLIFYALGLAIATFIEKYMGTPAAKTIIYYSPVFILLQFLLVVNFICVSLKHKLFQKNRRGYMYIHVALIVILAGALISHIFSKEGVIHLREGDTTDQMLIQTNQSHNYHKLPLKLELVKFTITRYPGSSSPSSFESQLIVHRNGQSFEKKISMNNVFDCDGYRFFQASYDKDEKGTILSVNQDVAGRNITYAGYILLVIGFIFCFTMKNSRFRQLSQNLKQLKNSAITAITLLLLGFPFTLNAQTISTEEVFEIIQKHEIDPGHAARFGALPLQSMDGRLEPVNTFSSEILRKLHHSDKIGNLNPDQFLLSFLTLSDIWMRIPFISLKNKNIASRYQLTQGKCAYNDLFDERGNYKLQDILEEVYAKPPAERSRFDKDLMKLDEQINICYQLVNREMLNIFPVENEPNHKWIANHELLDSYLEHILNGFLTGNWQAANNSLDSISSYQQEKSTITISSQQIKAELLYNRLNVFRICKKTYLIFGGVSLILSFLLLFKKRKAIQYGIGLLTGLVALGAVIHLFGIILRWYIAGYAPWSNAYETMVYISLITVVVGIFFARQNSITFALATLFGGIALFVSGLNWMDPQISPLVPVLKSPWLMIHVAVIVAAYGFFGIGFLLGITNLSFLSFNRKNKNSILAPHLQELTIINEMALWAGLALMTIGTFVGAVWANESWGRYWGWDPKETWALITILCYTIVTHLHRIKKWNSIVLFNLLSVMAFASVLMTYFGVNYFLSGMHSYN